MIEDTQQSRANDPDGLLNIELLRKYRETQQEWADRASKNKDYAHGYQFTTEQVDALSARGQAAVPINIVYPAMELAVSLMTANHPSFQATAQEDSDVKTAKVVSDLFTYVWQKNSGNMVLKEALYDMFQTGRGVLMPYIDPEADYGRAEIKLMALDPLKVLPDPNSRDRLWRDAAHILVEHLLTDEQIFSIWPDARDIIDSAEITHDDWTEFSSDRVNDEGISRDRQYDSFHHRRTVVERFTKTKIKYTHVQEPNKEEKIFLEEELMKYLSSPAVVMMTPQGPQFMAGDDAEKGLQLIRQAQPTEDPKVFMLQPPPQQDPQTGQEVQQPPIKLLLVTQSELVDDGIIQLRQVMVPRIKIVTTIGGILYTKSYLELEDYPIIPLMGRHDRDPYPLSDIDFVRPFQDSINKLHMQMVANLANSTNVKVFVPRGSVDKKSIEVDFSRAGAAILEYDPEMGIPVVVSPLPPPAGLFSHFSLLVSMVERELGVYAISQGDPSQVPDTFRGTLQIEESGQRRIKNKLDDVESALVILGRVIFTMMQQIYTEQKVIRIVQPNNSVKESIINQYQYDDLGNEVGRINDLTTASMDITVVAGSTLPSNRWAILDSYMELYQMGVIDQIEVLKKTDVADRDSVVERTSMISQLQKQVQQLNDDNKKLQGDLQTRDRESVNLRKRVEIAEFQAQLAVPTANSKAAATIYQARVDDELKKLRQVTKDKEKDSKKDIDKQF